MADGELINLERLGKVAERTKASNYRPAAAEVDKYINYYINDKKVPIDYRLASHKPANPSTSEEN